MTANSDWEHLAKRVAAAADPVTELRAHQTAMWATAGGPPAEEYLARFPDLSDEDAVVLVVAEAALRRGRGESPTVAEYQSRFPHLASDLPFQFELLTQLTDAPEEGPTRSVAVETAVGDLPAIGGTGAAIPGFDLVGELGRGAMGVVYLARDRRLNRTVAVKVIRSGSRADDEARRARFKAEAEAVATIRHPHVVQVFGSGEAESGPFMVLEHLPGGSLSDRLDGTAWPPRAAADVVRKLALGVAAAHRQGIVHRDLKPGNVLYDAGGEPKVADFGLVKTAGGSDLTHSDAVIGTPAYMAPEQAAGGAKFVGPAADVFALGVVLYEALTGARPFRADSVPSLLRQIESAAPRRPRAVVPGVPRDLEQVCLKCLEKAPADRYPTAQELADDLDRFLTNRSVLARPPGALGQLRKFAYRNRALVTAFAAAFAALVLGLAGTLTGLLRADAARVRAEAAERDARARLTESHAQAADLAMRRGAWRSALAALDQALAGGHPDEARLRLAKVRAWAALHEAGPAAAELRGLAARPDLGELEGPVLLAQADLALARGQDDEALGLARRARGRLPPADEAYADGLLAETIPEAIGHFRRAAQLDSFHQRAIGMAAVLELLVGEVTAARSRAAQARSMFPDDPTFAVLLALAAAAGGDMTAAQAELALARSQLGPTQAQSAAEFLRLVRGLRDLGGAFVGGNEALQKTLAKVQPALMAGQAAARGARAEGGGGPGLLLVVPPVFSRVMGEAVAAVAAAGDRAGGPGRAIVKLREAVRVYPDGLLLLFLGTLLSNEGRHAESEEVFRRATTAQSFVPVGRPALYALVYARWELADRGAGLGRAVQRARWTRQSLDSARQLSSHGDLQSDEVELIAAVADAAGDRHLGRWVVTEWERRGGTPTHTMLLLRMKAECHAGAESVAIALADRVLADGPDPATAASARAVRADAGKRLQERAKLYRPNP